MKEGCYEMMYMKTSARCKEWGYEMNSTWSSETKVISQRIFSSLKAIKNGDLILLKLKL